VTLPSFDNVEVSNIYYFNTTCKGGLATYKKKTINTG